MHISSKFGDPSSPKQLINVRKSFCQLMDNLKLIYPSTNQLRFAGAETEKHVIHIPGRGYKNGVLYVFILGYNAIK